MKDYLYHATPRANRDAILREGLVGPRGNTSVQQVGGAVITTTDTEWPHPIHMAFWDTREWVAEFYDEPLDLWVVDVTGLVLYAGWDGDTTYAVIDPLPPERLRLVDDPEEQPNFPRPTRGEFPSHQFD